MNNLETWMGLEVTGGSSWPEMRKTCIVIRSLVKSNFPAQAEDKHDIGNDPSYNVDEPLSLAWSLVLPLAPSC